jgi:hypothetical protein
LDKIFKIIKKRNSTDKNYKLKVFGFALTHSFKQFNTQQHPKKQRIKETTIQRARFYATIHMKIFTMGIIFDYCVNYQQWSIKC